MRNIRTRAVVLTATIGLTGSLAAVAGPTYAADAPSAAASGQRYTYDFKTGKTTDPQAAAAIKKLLAALPKDWQAKRAAAIAQAGVEVGPIGKAIQAKLNGAPCEPTELNDYIDRLLNGIPNNKLFVLAFLGVLDYPTYDALLFGTKTNPDYSLTPGTVPKVRQTAAAAKSFWDIKSGDIDVMGMHSDMVVDRDRVIRIVKVLFGANQSEAAEIADLVIGVVKSTIQLRDGDNPIFTLNAYAFTAEGDPDPLIQGISDRIVMGEGIIKALRDTGDIEVGPQMIFSHEFGHHIQFENDAFPAEQSPENTRKMELMADAYGTYLDAHKQGLNFNEWRINGAVEVAHLVGDCAVDNLGHHGTPDQRAAAAQWGATLAKKNGNMVLPSKRFEQMFLQALPGILNA